VWGDENLQNRQEFALAGGLGTSSPKLTPHLNGEPLGIENLSTRTAWVRQEADCLLAVFENGHRPAESDYLWRSRCAEVVTVPQFSILARVLDWTCGDLDPNYKLQEVYVSHKGL